MATSYRKKLDLERRSLCLSCCQPFDNGYCQVCFERQSQAMAHRADAGRRRCRECGQWREADDGQCECWRERP